MQVYKFGGISIKNAKAIKNISKIIGKTSVNTVVVISAIGKMTNKFELLIAEYLKKSDYNMYFNDIKKYHYTIIKELFKDNSEIYNSIELLFSELSDLLNLVPSDDYDYEYDKIIVYGELLSTTIISYYLNSINIKNNLIDIRENIITDGYYRDGRVLWNITEQNIKNNFLFKNTSLYITQGFIASGNTGKSVTLGREGSDFTASIIAFSLNATNVTIWKDVPGILSADPRIFNDTKKIDALNYKETVELAYYGAQVIHPKTIKPLQNKNIPLYVKSFINYNDSGTIINDNKTKIIFPIIILKKNQVLISISPKDFSFIDEANISKIYKELAKLKIKINLMENSAVSFSIITDFSEKIDSFINNLEKYYSIKYNTNLELITIRHYNTTVVNKLLLNKKILVEQRTRYTARFAVKNN